MYNNGIDQETITELSFITIIIIFSIKVDRLISDRDSNSIQPNERTNEQRRLFQHFYFIVQSFALSLSISIKILAAFRKLLLNWTPALKLVEHHHFTSANRFFFARALKQHRARVAFYDMLEKTLHRNTYVAHCKHSKKYSLNNRALFLVYSVESDFVPKIHRNYICL